MWLFHHLDILSRIAAAWLLLAIIVASLLSHFRMWVRRRSIKLGIPDEDYYAKLECEEQFAPHHVRIAHGREDCRMNALADYIIREAEERVYSGRILSGGALTSFLHAASYRDDAVSERELIDAALDKGLYADLGSKYQCRLTGIIDEARREIESSAIKSNASLREFLAVAARSVSGGYDPLKVERDLLIDARQGGLYEHLSEESAFEWDAHEVRATAEVAA
jgi:hypothetical protein